MSILNLTWFPNPAVINRHFGNCNLRGIYSVYFIIYWPIQIIWWSPIYFIPFVFFFNRLKILGVNNPCNFRNLLRPIQNPPTESLRKRVLERCQNINNLYADFANVKKKEVLWCISGYVFRIWISIMNVILRSIEGNRIYVVFFLFFFGSTLTVIKLSIGMLFRYRIFWIFINFFTDSHASKLWLKY